MCINNHDPGQMITTDDGRRVCLKCRKKYHRRTRIQGYRVAPSPRGAPSYERNQR